MSENYSAFSIQHSALTLVIGDANADISAHMQHYPQEGGDSLLSELTWSSGGSGANVATDLALLGAQVRLVARVGADSAASYALQAARSAGVDLTAIQTDAHQATGLCYAAISASGERTLFSYRGASAHLSYPEHNVLAECGWLHIAGHALIEGQQCETTLQLLENARQLDIACSLDICLPLIDTQRQTIIELMPQLTLLFANQAEMLALAQETTLEMTIQKLGSLLPEVTAIKLGAQGSLLLCQGKQLKVSAPAVEVCDTTGCGDAFVAGFLDALQKTGNPEYAVRRATLCGAAVARHSGAVMDRSDVEWLRNVKC